MKSERLTKEKDGVVLGVLCGTKNCKNQYLSKGCLSCKMFNKVLLKLKMLEDFMEEISDERL